MPTYAELRHELETALAAAQSNLAAIEARIARNRARYGRAYDRPERRWTLKARIAELELNLEALDYEQAARCAAADPNL